MDNPVTEPSGEVTPVVVSPESGFEALLSGEKPPEAPAEPDAPDAPDVPAEDNAQAEGDLFTVKVDGKEIQVSRDELLNGYSRQADYSRKTAELSQQRQQIEQVANAVLAERQQHQAQLAQMAQALGQQLGEQAKTVNWQQLLDENPQQYLKERHLFEQRQAALQGAQRAQQQAAYEAQQTQSQQLQQRLTQEHQSLTDKLPEWKDEAKATSERASLREFLVASGYGANEIDDVQDHRAVVMARKAMLYDQLQAQADAATKRVSTLPPKVIRPGVAQTNAGDGRTTAMRELARRGTTDAASRAFEQFLR